MLPVSATIVREPDGKAHTYNVKVVRVRSMLGQLVHMSLANSVDMEGNWPDEISARVKARIEIEGREPLILDDWFAGNQLVGDRAPQMLYQPVGIILQQLANNSFENVCIKSVECTTDVLEGRRVADIEGSELESDTLAPGETLKAGVTLRTFKGPKQRIASVKLPRICGRAVYPHDQRRLEQPTRTGNNPQLGAANA